MRKIIVVLLVLCAKIAQAQIYIDSYRFAGAPAANLLLDDYPGAAAAYSLRKLDKDYTGSAIRIRTAGGSETDIGFDSNGNLNTAAITTFCAGTTCTVTTWYDQSGNGRNATQATAANQPTIYTGGALVTIGGDPSLSFDGINDALVGSHTFSFNDYSFNFVGGQVSFTFEYHRFFDIGSLNGVFLSSAATSGFVTFHNQTANPFGPTHAISNNVQYIFTQNRIRSSGANKTSINNLSETNTTGGTNATTSSVLSIGNRSLLDRAANVKVNELLIWPIDNNSDKPGILSNINSYYSIY